MKLKLFLLLVLFSIITYAQPTILDRNPVQVGVTVTSGTDYVDVEINQIVTQKGWDVPKLGGFFTDATMTSTSVTFQVYDETNATYKSIGNSDGTIAIVANKYYSVSPSIFKDVVKFRMLFNAAEAADRSIILNFRVY